MKKLLQQFEKYLNSIQGIEDELLPPATPEELDAVEIELGIKFPEDLRELYMWHNGNKGDLFLFGSYRISPLNEIIELYKSAHKTMDKDWYQVTDDFGVFKDCICNTKWIQFADNGGNTIVFLDMDPANQGVEGQILESCDGEIECHFSGIKEFMSDISDRISKGELAWDDEAGSFWETGEESVVEQERYTEKVKLVDDSPTFHELQHLHAGENVTLTGAIKSNHKTQKHQLFIKGGSIRVNGKIGKIYTPLSGVPPLVKMKVLVGKKSLFGFGTPSYEVISCELIPQ